MEATFEVHSTTSAHLTALKVDRGEGLQQIEPNHTYSLVLPQPRNA